MCEYDALPEMGHACGHNLIAESSVAAALGVKEALGQNDKLSGKVCVFYEARLSFVNSHIVASWVFVSRTYTKVCSIPSKSIVLMRIMWAEIVGWSEISPAYLVVVLQHF